MKISGAGAEPFPAIRRLSPPGAGAKAVAASPGADEVEFLGVSETELTPAVRGAIAMLVVELEDLRTEVRRLKALLLEAEAAADEDPLTRVKNRRGFLRELKRLASFAGRYDTPASLAYFDLDDLKAINDRFGHAAGDAALTAAAGILSANVRESDVVGRLGGDEFAVAFAHADAATAAAKAESLAHLISSEAVSGGDGLIAIRVSWGVRQLDSALDPEQILAEADAAMFAMKRGRG
ncbi:MAG TPA: GGDEF domain-containing protein [Caulobacteraceae bacterium]|nr:GGDEF domain-containing protein [Caulobacteraceae bacterium]